MNAIDPIGSMTPDYAIDAVLHSPDVVAQYGVASHHGRDLVFSVCPTSAAITHESMLRDWVRMAQRARANQSIHGKGPADWAVLFYPVVGRAFPGGPGRPYLYTVTDTLNGRMIRVYNVGRAYDARFPAETMPPDRAVDVPSMLGGGR